MLLKNNYLLLFIFTFLISVKYDVCGSRNPKQRSSLITAANFNNLTNKEYKFKLNKSPTTNIKQSYAFNNNSNNNDNDNNNNNNNQLNKKLISNNADLSKFTYLNKSFNNIAYINNTAKFQAASYNYPNVVQNYHPYVLKDLKNDGNSIFMTQSDNRFNQQIPNTNNIQTVSRSGLQPVPRSVPKPNEQPFSDSLYSNPNLNTIADLSASFNSNYEYKCQYNEQPRIPVMTEQQRDYSIVAKIHKSGYQGYVLFTNLASANLNIDSISVKTHIIISRTHGQPIKEAFSWRIYNQHSIDSYGSCSLFLTSDNLLHDLTTLFGPIITGKLSTFGSEEFNSAINQPTYSKISNKHGLSNLIGKTLMLIGVESGVRICTTLLPAGIKYVYEAKLHYPIAGRLKVVQGNNQKTAAMMAEYLMYSNGERKESKHKWQIIETTNYFENNDYEEIYNKQYNIEKNYCSNLEVKYIMPSDEINDYNQLIVNTEMPTLRGRSSHIITTYNPLNTYKSLYLVFYDAHYPDKIISCSPLKLMRPKVASASFNEPVYGTINLSQETPLDPTKIVVNLNFTNTLAYSYGIDALPLIKRRKSEIKKCPNIQETIFNPSHINSENVPFEGQGTTDQYAVGDLSGKFCSIIYPNIFSTNTYEKQGNEPIKQLTLHSYDYNLPLFGKNSVIGRALVFYDVEGNAISCANIEQLGNSIITAYATFDQPIQGQFIFRQLENYCEDEVFVYVEISKPDTLNAIKTDNHEWNIHEYPIKTNLDALSTTNCASVGNNFNPYNVSRDSTYLRDCTSVTTERCERGDCSSKLAPISITPYKPSFSEQGDKKNYGEPEVAKYYFVDNQMSLCGPNSIIGKSIVVHEKNFGLYRISCSNILKFSQKN